MCYQDYRRTSPTQGERRGRRRRRKKEEEKERKSVLFEFLSLSETETKRNGSSVSPHSPSVIKSVAIYFIGEWSRGIGRGG